MKLGSSGSFALATILSLALCACSNDNSTASKTPAQTGAQQASNDANQPRPQEGPDGMAGAMGAGGMGGDDMGDGMGPPMGPMAPYNPLPRDDSELKYTADTVRCERVKGSVADAGFSDKVKVDCGGPYVYITANTIPDHPLLTGIKGTNEQTVAPAEDFTQYITISPEFDGEPHTRDASLAVAVNGVPIYDYTTGGEMELHMLETHQPQLDALLVHQLDICGGHAGRGDDYHYHVRPNCMIDMMANKDDPSAIIAWAFDGFPIFKDTKPDGSPIAKGELDVCNGMPDDEFGYRYHTSEAAPYIIQCLMGNVDNIDRFPKIIPPHPKGDLTREKEPGFPPRDGVEDLVFSTMADGTKSLDYNYQGEAYYIRYKETNTVNCFQYTEKTITRGGQLHEGEYCR